MRLFIIIVGVLVVYCGAFMCSRHERLEIDCPEDFEMLKSSEWMHDVDSGDVCCSIKMTATEMDIFRRSLKEKGYVCTNRSRNRETFEKEERLLKRLEIIYLGAQRVQLIYTVSPNAPL